MGKNIDYRQLTIRIPPKVFEILASFADRRSLTLNDAILVILLDYFGLIGGDE